MDLLFGIAFLCAGIGLAVFNRRIASEVARSNAAAFQTPSASSGFAVYARLVFYALSIGFIALGIGFTLGMLNFS